MADARVAENFHLEEYVPSQAELDALLGQANFLDPKGEGFTTATIKPLQPRMTWTVFSAQMQALIDAGKIRTETVVVPPKGKYLKYFVIR